MRIFYFFQFMILAYSSIVTGCNAQSSYGTEFLHLEREISMPGVKGRIDHLEVNLKEQLLYVAALGNNTLEVIDLRNSKTLYTIKGLSEPQGIGYIPQHEEIFVANGGSGDCYFFNAHTYEKTATIHLSSDADDVRFDSVNRKIYVGYGEGGIAIIDADNHKQIGDIKLPAHPESFQIDKKLNLLFVNLPDAHMVGVIDLLQLKLTQHWVRETPTSNFPMALDTINHHLFVGYRKPAKLLVFDCKTGSEIGLMPMTGDADDLYYDNANKDVYVSGGDGHINIFRSRDVNSYKQIADIPTRNGARTSLFISQLNLFVIAGRADFSKPAAILIYKTVK